MTSQGVRRYRGLFSEARLAVSMIFLANGFLVGSWAPKIPEFAERLSLTESALGIMIFFFGVGSLVAMPLTGAAIARRGSQPALRLMALLALFNLPLVTFAPGAATAALALLVFGATIGGMDVAMNANAVEVERNEGKAIMSSCHGFWSLGGVLGSALGGILIDAAGTAFHALAATLAATLLTAAAWHRVIADPPHESAGNDRVPHAGGSLFSSGLTVWAIGLMCLFSMLPEGATLDWSALYLRQELGADTALSGLAFGAFSATMAAMRFLGDIVRDRVGAVRTLRFSAVLAMAGLLIAGQASGPGLAAAGFAIAGLGLANMVPICFSAAGNLPGLPQGVAISLVTFMGYSGILFAPSLIGFIAERTGLAAIYSSIPLLLAFVVAAARLVRHADRNIA